MNTRGYEPPSGDNLPPGCFEDAIERAFAYVEGIDPGCPVESEIRHRGIDLHSAKSCLMCEDPCPYVCDEYPFLAQAYPLSGDGTE